MAAVGHTTSSRLQELRTLLLDEERASRKEINDALRVLEEKMLDPEVQKAQLQPHFDEHVAYLQEKFPELFAESLNKALAKQIRDSRDSMIEALYPIIGRLISRYIKAEMEQLAERIEAAQRAVFSLKAWKMRIKAWTTPGVSYADLVMQERNKPKLLELLLVDNHRGLLIGSYSVGKLLEPDIVAGMFTGIKEFVEHAFQGGVQELEVLEYERYKVIIHTFPGVYFAAVAEGIITPVFREKLEQAFLEFGQQEKLAAPEEVTSEVRSYWDTRLKAYFDGFNKMDQ
ncbi:MAG: hypothetical protein R3B47_06815 [Bacteroidia bacterium]